VLDELPGRRVLSLFIAWLVAFAHVGPKQRCDILRVCGQQLPGQEGKVSEVSNWVC
jgi:hypothetical protein